MTHDEYHEYLQSARWQIRRLAKLDLADYRCERCGDGRGKLEVHHLTYERLGRERLEDLVVLCDACHCRAHGIPRGGAPAVAGSMAADVLAKMGRQ